MIVNGEDLLDKSAQQEQEQARLEAALVEEKRREQEMARDLEAQEEARLGLEDHYSSLEQEVEGKTKKLKKLWTKFKAAQAEINDIQEEHAREKEDILDTIRELSRQLKLKQLVMSSFIPLDQLSKIERCSEWDEQNEQWRISRLQYAGNKAKKREEASSKGKGRKTPEQSAAEPPLLDAAKAMGQVFFSYAETDAAAPEGELLAPEEQQQLDAEREAERTAAAAARKEKLRKQEQAKLDRALG